MSSVLSCISIKLGQKVKKKIKIEHFMLEGSSHLLVFEIKTKNLLYKYNYKIMFII
jgi:hypothetical protein